MENQEEKKPSENNGEIKHQNQKIEAETPLVIQNEKPKVDINFVNLVYEKTKNEIQKVIVGNEDLIQLTLAGMFTGGHILFQI